MNCNNCSYKVEAGELVESDKLHTHWICPKCKAENVFRSKSKLDGIIEERGKNYGPPILHFSCTQNLYLQWIDRKCLSSFLPLNKQQNDALCHGVYMILDKLTRAAENPLHMDNWDDIEGYVKCIRTILEVKANAE